MKKAIKFTDADLVEALGNHAFQKGLITPGAYTINVVFTQDDGATLTYEPKPSIPVVRPSKPDDMHA